MARRLHVEVRWDGEAGVWIAVAPDIGLFTESGTLDGLRDRVPRIAADLLSDNPAENLDLQIELIVRFEQTVSAAA